MKIVIPGGSGQIGALFLQTETELILKSRRVIPGRLLQSGFEFNFPIWAAAADDLCRRWRERRQEGNGNPNRSV